MNGLFLALTTVSGSPLRRKTTQASVYLESFRSREKSGRDLFVVSYDVDMERRSDAMILFAYLNGAYF